MNTPRDSGIYIPSATKHKLSLLAKKANESEFERQSADSIGAQYIEEMIAQKHPEFAAAYAEREDWDKRLMETIK